MKPKIQPTTAHAIINKHGQIVKIHPGPLHEATWINRKKYNQKNGYQYIQVHITPT